MKNREDHSDTEAPPSDLIGDIPVVTLFRALGYAVGLPSFIVGTAIFMLGFSLQNIEFINVGCILYSVALVAIGGRPVLLRLNPQSEIQAIKISALSLICGSLFYLLLLIILTGFGFKMI